MKNKTSSLELSHFPVMLNEVLKISSPFAGCKFVDCTFGGGSYTKEILKIPNTNVKAFDRDKHALKLAKNLERKFPGRFKFYQSKFSHVSNLINHNVDAVIFDLGLSSIQLNDLNRGFSFKSNKKLDMSMGLNKITALEVINNLSEKNLKWSFLYERRGLWYLKGTKYRGKQLHEQYKIQDIKFIPNDVVIDIGANIGDFYLGFDDKINYYGYEPSPSAFSCLKYNIKNQNLFNLGLSNTEGNTIDFYLSDEFGDSSILPIKNYTKKIIIETTTLDKEIAKINRKIKLMSLDFILIPFCILIILFLLNKENRIYKRNQKVK